MKNPFLKRAHDEKRFKNSMYRYYSDLYRFVYARLGSELDAEDVVQKTYLKAFRAFRGFTNDSGPKVWLVCILINTIRDHVRKIARSPKTLPLDQLHKPEYKAGDGRSHLADPADLVSRDEIDHELLQALNELPDTFLAPLLLREIDDASYRTIASILEIPIGTVMSRLSRARTLLKDKLIKTGNCPSSLDIKAEQGRPTNISETS